MGQDGPARKVSSERTGPSSISASPGVKLGAGNTLDHNRQARRHALAPATGQDAGVLGTTAEGPSPALLAPEVARPMRHLEHTYMKTLLLLSLSFRFTGHPVFLWPPL